MRRRRLAAPRPPQLGAPAQLLPSDLTWGDFSDIELACAQHHGDLVGVSGMLLETVTTSNSRGAASRWGQQGGLMEKGCWHHERGQSLIRCMGRDCALLAELLPGADAASLYVQNTLDDFERVFPAHAADTSPEEQRPGETGAKGGEDGERAGGRGSQGWECGERQRGNAAADGYGDGAGSGCGEEGGDAGANGMFVAVLRDYKVVADGVVCPARAPHQRITTWAIKHKSHDAVPHGCVKDANHPEVYLARALLAVGWNGWFWGHFVQDVLSKIAFAVDALERQGRKEERGAEAGREVLESVAFIIEGDSQGNVLPMLHALVGAAVGSGAALDLAQRIYVMDRECLRGNARFCAHYFHVGELLIADSVPHASSIARPVRQKSLVAGPKEPCSRPKRAL